MENKALNMVELEAYAMSISANGVPCLADTEKFSRALSATHSRITSVMEQLTSALDFPENIRACMDEHERIKLEATKKDSNACEEVFTFHSLISNPI
jgi:hypothetical protein